MQDAMTTQVKTSEFLLTEKESLYLKQLVHGEEIRRMRELTTSGPCITIDSDVEGERMFAPPVDTLDIFRKLSRLTKRTVEPRDSAGCKEENS